MIIRRCGRSNLLRKLIEAFVQVSYVRLKSVYRRLDGLRICLPGAIYLRLESVEIRPPESAQLRLHSRELGLQTLKLCFELRGIECWRRLHSGFELHHALFKPGDRSRGGDFYFRFRNFCFCFRRKRVAAAPYQAHAAEGPPNRQWSWPRSSTDWSGRVRSSRCLPSSQVLSVTVLLSLCASLQVKALTMTVLRLFVQRWRNFACFHLTGITFYAPPSAGRAK